MRNLVSVIIIIYTFCASSILSSWWSDTDTTLIIDADIIDVDVMIDTSAVSSDTVAPVIIHLLNPNIGTTLVSTDVLSFTDSPLTKFAIQAKNYVGLADLLYQVVPAVPLSTTLLGNHTNFSYMGVQPKHNRLSLNGVQMDGYFGLVNWDAISPEFSNSIELYDGFCSSVLGGAGGLYVNHQTSLFNTASPYTRLWFVQGDNKMIGVDGIFSQNFLPNWNITAGFKRMSSNSYYQNSFYDYWNGRLAVTYIQNDFSTFKLLYNFSNNYNGLFGGINFSDYNTNNNISSQVRSNFNNFRDRVYKSDYILSYSLVSLVDSVGLLLDTGLIINTNVFVSHNESNYLFESDSLLNILLPKGDSTSVGINYGINTNLKYKLKDGGAVFFGGEVASDFVPSSIITEDYSGVSYYLFSKSEYRLFDAFDLGFGARYGYKFGEHIWALGGAINKSIKDWQFFVDASYMKTNPEPIFNYRNETHLLTFAGFKHKNKHTYLSAKLFYRNVREPILLEFNKETIGTFVPSYIDVSNQNIVGIMSDISFKLPLNIDVKMLLSDYIDMYSNNDSYHNLYTSLALQYTYMRGLSVLTFGLKSNFLYTDSKYYFNPVFNSYSRSDLSGDFETDGISAYLVAKLGNCYIRINFNNILGSDFSYLAYYPILKQEFCLSFTWGFPHSNQ